MQPVRADDWKRTPLPAHQAVLEIDHAFDATEMQAIRLGLLPEVMEDKWFLYFEDGRLHFHRSWTGYCIFVARFEPEDDGSARLVDALVNRDPEQYRSDDVAHEAEMVLTLIDMLLLGRVRPLPTHRTDETERSLESWSVAGRAILGRGARPGR